MKNLVKEIIKEINDIITLLITTGICDEFNYPSEYKEGEITKISWSNCHDLSKALKNVEYDEIYSELLNNKQYNIKLADGMLVQMLYSIEDNKIISHRLAVFPSRDLESYQNQPELYQNDYIYADVLSKNIVTFPIRFDFERRDIPKHPKSHLSLGQYKNCRIPVFGPIMPKTFIVFILKNFYNSFYEDRIGNLLDSSYRIEYTIKADETKHLHFYLR